MHFVIFNRRCGRSSRCRTRLGGVRVRPARIRGPRYRGNPAEVGVTNVYAELGTSFPTAVRTEVAAAMGGTLIRHGGRPCHVGHDSVGTARR